ncbi:MAG: CHAT domain-containing protein [Candidatus Kapaibacteriales bacterium]
MPISGLFSQDWKDAYTAATKAYSQRDFTTAEQKAKEHLNLITKQFGEEGKYHIAGYNLLGKIYFAVGNYDDAIKNYQRQKELALTTSGPDHPGYAQSLNNLAVVYTLIGEDDRTEELLKDAIENKEKRGQTADTSYAKYIGNLGQYYQNQGRYPEAERLLRKSLELKQKSYPSDAPTLGVSYANLGLTQASIGNKDEGIDNLRKAEQILKNNQSIEYQEFYEKASLQLALELSKAGKKDEASQIQENLIANLDSGDPNSVGNMQSQLALAQLMLTQQNQNQAIKILDKLKSNVNTTFGNGHPLYGKSLNILGIAYWQKKDYQNARNYFDEALQLAKLVYGDKHLEYAMALHNRAGIARKTDDVAVARKYYNESFEIYIDILEKNFPHYTEAQKISFYNSLKDRLDMYANFAISHYREEPKLLEDLFNFRLKTKAMVLDYSKSLFEFAMASENEAIIEKAKEWKTQKRKIASLSGKSKAELSASNLHLDLLQSSADDLEIELSESLNLSQIKKSFNFEDIASKLKPNEAAIEIIRMRYFDESWSDKIYYVALIATNGSSNPEIVLSKNGQKMEGFHYKNYKSLIKAKFPNKKSYEVYFKEIEEKIKNKKNVYLSADGVYNNISLASISRDDDSYLIDDYSFRTVNNLKDILIKDNTTDFTRNAALFGNPTYQLDGNNLDIKDPENAKALEKLERDIIISQLPGTQKEVESIDELLASNGYTVVNKTQSEASEQTIKKVNSPGILHIATHGYFIDDDDAKLETGKVFGTDIENALVNPLLRSGLLFSGATDYINFDGSEYYDDENGMFTALEASQLDLHDTKLVVLSACETGLGKIVNGEGVMGLQRSFQVAGADYVIMSLWTVSDNATQKLMTSFYSNLMQSQNITASFRQAQLDVKSEFEDPYYWGAFVVVGI